MIAFARDKYDEEVERLQNVSLAEVRQSWAASRLLFKLPGRISYHHNLGCLTMVRRGGYQAETQELTVAIKNDTRLPGTRIGLIDGDAARIKAALPVFAEWQRYLRGNEHGLVGVLEEGGG